MLTLRLRTAVCGCAPTKQDDLPALGLIPSGGVFLRQAPRTVGACREVHFDLQGEFPRHQECSEIRTDRSFARSKCRTLRPDPE